MENGSGRGHRTAVTRVGDEPQSRRRALGWTEFALRSKPLDMPSLTALRRAAFALALTAACHCSPKPPADSPRAVAEAVVQALNTNGLAVYVEALPRRADVDAHLDCGDRDTVGAVLARTIEEAPVMLEGWRQAGMRVRLTALHEAEAEVLQLSVGESVRDCTVKAVFEIKRIPIHLTITKGGRTEELREVWPFWRFPGRDRWNYARF